MHWHCSKNVLYNQINPGSSEIIKTTTIPLEFRYSFTDVYSLTFINETQWANNSINIGDKNFMNQYNSLTFSSSPSLVLTVTSEFTNNDDEPTGKSSWFTGEISYKLNQSNTFGVSYGSERGGLNALMEFADLYNHLKVSGFDINTILTINWNEYNENYEYNFLSLKNLNLLISLIKF
ncbi:MAG: hypothetical protein R3A12_14945 [Ignavibacteria bacterium]